MINTLLIVIGKFISAVIQKLNLGNGSTWPGHIALKCNKRFLQQLVSKNKSLQIIIVAGTNGKTTTSRMINTILQQSGNRVIQNQSGANLLNGIASTLILNADILGKIHADSAIFEIDENALPQITREIQPNYLILLNLFRDQLDRYGEVRAIAAKWQSSLTKLNKTTFIVNGDDPELYYLVHELKSPVSFFGLDEKNNIGTTPEHAADSTYCPRCGEKLQYASITYSHLGKWACTACNLQRPTLNLASYENYPMTGTYNKYNTLAAILTAQSIGVSKNQTQLALTGFQPAFGRQETIEIDGRKVQLFLSKNPTGFNESLRTIKELGAKYIFIILNDRIPDGTDVSWIWDVDFETLLTKKQHIFISGDRAYDMEVRLKYTHTFDQNIITYPELQTNAIQSALQHVPKNETLFILPTYSAMLEARKILTGKKIL